MFSVNCNCSFSIIGQPLDGLNNLGPSWSGFNAVIGAEQNKTLPLDLMEVELHNGRKIISFLGVTIGLVADVDLGRSCRKNVLKLDSNTFPCKKLFYINMYRF